MLDSLAIPGEKARIVDSMFHTPETSKGTADEPGVRCRLVARDFKVGKAADCFSASMPPLEAKKILVAKIAERYSG